MLNKYRVFLSKFKSTIWTNFTQTSNVFSLTLGVYVLVRFFGYWSFSVEFGKSAKTRAVIHVKPFDWFWSISSIIICLSCVAYQYQTYYDFAYLNVSLVEMTINEMSLVAISFITIVCIVSDLANRNVIWQIIKNFYDFDEEVSLHDKLLLKDR